MPPKVRAGEVAVHEALVCVILFHILSASIPGGTTF